MAVEKRRSKELEDFTTNRLMTIITAAFVLVVGLIIAYRGYANVATYITTHTIMFVLMWVGLAATVGCAYLAYRASVKYRGQTRYKLFTAWHFTVFAVVFTVCAFFGWYFVAAGVKAMYAFVAAAAALLLVYLMYPTDLFGIAGVSSCAAALLWYISRATGDGLVWERGVKAGKPLYLTIVSIVLLVAYAAAGVYLRNNKGSIKLGGNTHVIYPRTARYRISFITAALALLCIVAAYIFGATVAFYLMFVMLAWLFTLVVYFTVKMM